MHNDDKHNQYISLKEASKFSDYSRDYLSLRARQGKLKAVKLGRNWVTTKEWFDEYVDRVNKYKEEHSKNNDEENLDVKNVDICKENQTNDISPKSCNKRPVLTHAIVVVAALVFILFLGGIALGHYNNSILRPLSSAVNSVIASIGLGMGEVAENITENQTFQYVSESVKYAPEYVNQYIKYLSETKSIQYVAKETMDIKENIVIGINVVSNKVSESKLFEYGLEATKYVNEKAIIAMNIISEKTLGNKLFANIQIPNYIKSSIGENTKNLKKFTGEITNKIFYSIKEYYESFILFCDGVLSSEIEMSR